MIKVEIRPTSLADATAVLGLFQAAASAPGGLARAPDEVDLAYVQGFMGKAMSGGVSLSAWEGHVLCGEIHANRIGPRQFGHVLSDLTIAVHPGWQGRGVGTQLFRGLFEAAAQFRPRVERIELMVREGNAGAIALYGRLSFVAEGRFERRVRLADGAMEADIAMGLLL